MTGCFPYGRYRDGKDEMLFFAKDQTPMANQCILGPMIKSGPAKKAKADKRLEDRATSMDILIFPFRSPTESEFRVLLCAVTCKSR